MRLFRMSMLLLMVPLMLAGKRVEVRIDSPVQISAAVADDMGTELKEMGKGLKEAGEELQRSLNGIVPPALMPPGAILPIPQESIVPDVFPSQRAAIRSLAEQWVRQLVLSLERMPTSVHIVVSGRNTPNDVIHELRNAVHNQLLGGQCEIHMGDVKPASAASAGAVWGEFELTPGEHQGEGTVRLKSNVPALAAISAAYVSKPWADNFTEYVNGRPQVERWVVGQSQRTCTKPVEATRDAILQAADSVDGLLRTRMSGMGHMMRGVDAGWLAAKVQGELERGGFVRDRFVQRYERPYGTLWRESVLVDVSDANIDNLVASVLDDLRVRHVAVRTTALSVLGLLVVIYLLYLLVNAVTKGYFVWRLRTAAVVLAAIGVAILMWFVTARFTWHGSSVQPANHAVPGYRMEY